MSAAPRYGQLGIHERDTKPQNKAAIRVLRTFVRFVSKFIMISCRSRNKLRGKIEEISASSRAVSCCERARIGCKGHLEVQDEKEASHVQTRKIITSVAFMSAAAVCPGFNCISRAELAVIIDVIC
jgi:hypothetical protein